MTGSRYLRTVDADALGAAAAGERFAQNLIGRATGAQTCAVDWIRTPPGGGSPAGLHTHEVDQLFWIVEGTMSIEVDGERFDAGPGSLVVFPAGVAHRNWNAGAVPTVHLAVNTPAPDLDRPFATTVED